MRGSTRLNASWILLLAVSVVGCSPVQRIAANAAAIRDEAATLEAHGIAIGDPVVIDGAVRIQGYADGIHGNLGGVQDRTPSWVTAIVYGGVAVVAVAVVIILWQTGLGQAVRVAVGWLPRRKVAQAELAVDMLDPSRPEGDRELVAAMRAQDPEFDAAYRKAQQRKKHGTPR